MYRFLWKEFREKIRENETILGEGEILKRRVGKKKRSLAEEEGDAWNIQLNSVEAREGDNFAQIYLNTVLG